MSRRKSRTEVGKEANSEAAHNSIEVGNKDGNGDVTSAVEKDVDMTES